MDLSDIKLRMQDVYGSPLTAEDALYTRLINDAYRSLAAMSTWWWLKKKSIIRVSPATSSTMTATLGTTTLTPASGEQISTDYTDGYLYSGGHTYRITTILATTPYTVTLDAEWIEASGSYDMEVWKDTYELPSDFSYAMAVTVRSDPNHLPLRFISEEEMDSHGMERYSGAIEQASVCCVRKDLQIGTSMLLQIYPVPSEECEYLVTYYANITELSSDSDEPDLPVRFHDVLANLAIAKMLKMDREDADVIAHWDTEARLGMARLLEEQGRMEPTTYRFGRRGYTKEAPIKFKTVNVTSESV